MSAQDVMKMMKDHEVKFVDFRFTDTKGKEQHVSIPASVVDEEFFEEEEAPKEEPGAEDTSEEAKEPLTPPAKPFNMGLGVGSVTIDGELYNQIALRPEFKLGNLGIGFDLVVYIDNEGNVRKDEWDEASDFVDKFSRSQP